MLPWRTRAPAAGEDIKGRLGVGPGAVRMPRPSPFTCRPVLEPRRMDEEIFNDSGSDGSYISKPSNSSTSSAPTGSIWRATRKTRAAGAGMDLYRAE